MQVKEHFIIFYLLTSEIKAVVIQTAFDQLGWKYFFVYLSHFKVQSNIKSRRSSLACYGHHNPTILCFWTTTHKGQKNPLISLVRPDQGILYVKKIIKKNILNFPRHFSVIQEALVILIVMSVIYVIYGFLLLPKYLRPQGMLDLLEMDLHFIQG